MAKKMKLNLEDLKVQSFVTTLNEDSNEIKGGLTGTNPACNSQNDPLCTERKWCSGMACPQ